MFKKKSNLYDHKSIFLKEERNLGSETVLTEFCENNSFDYAPGPVRYLLYSEINFSLL